jgi:hypothetical protein
MAGWIEMSGQECQLGAAALQDTEGQLKSIPWAEIIEPCAVVLNELFTRFQASSSTYLICSI